MDEDDRNEADLKRPDPDDWEWPLDAIVELAADELLVDEDAWLGAAIEGAGWASEWSD